MSQFSEGTVVVVPNRHKIRSGEPDTATGTIIQCTHGQVLVLDAQGIIHVAHIRDIYLAQ